MPLLIHTASVQPLCRSDDRRLEDVDSTLRNVKPRGATRPSRVSVEDFLEKNVSTVLGVKEVQHNIFGQYDSLSAGVYDATMYGTSQPHMHYGIFPSNPNKTLA